ncbi:DUF1864 family protein [Mesorhizobium sp. M0659]|uniref:monodechloroaminopyrrolnitrin synthase PrnB family protein n=1 Tax=Mesorhizobium sp. M0659 TaxID=2956980 RepID=UPI003338F272
MRGVPAFDHWLRNRFKDLNTELEETYFKLDDPASVDGVRDDLKIAIREEGRGHIAAILCGALPLQNTDAAYDLLGSVGLYMAALRRHELTNPEREMRSPLVEASALAQTLSAAIGVAPRFATAHVNLSNLAIEGHHKSFTHLAEELLFIKYNCLSILGYIRTADILRRVFPLGVTHPVAEYLFDKAAAALEDVERSNTELDEKLDVRRFFYNVRPYFKTYRVGRSEYRGANAGDFAAINEIDLMLGLCRSSDPTYSALLIEKMPFMTASDQQLLQASARQVSLLDEFLAVVDKTGDLPELAVAPLSAFIRACDIHGRTAAQHHDRLVRRFIEQPSIDMPQQHMAQITASGPPLPVLMNALEVLRDKRLAANRQGIDSRYSDLERLRSLCSQNV